MWLWLPSSRFLIFSQTILLEYQRELCFKGCKMTSHFIIKNWLVIRECIGNSWQTELSSQVEWDCCKYTSRTQLLFVLLLKHASVVFPYSLQNNILLNKMLSFYFPWILASLLSEKSFCWQSRKSPQCILEHFL